MANNLILSYNDGNGLSPMNFKKLSNSEVVSIQNKNSLQGYDSFLHNELTENIFKRDFDKIFIPISLNEFYLPFTGIILGLHFRLTQNEDGKNLLPIIFYADENETKEFIARHSIYGYFLFTKGVHLISDNIEDFKEISSKNLKPIDRTYVEIELVKRVIIPAPSFYDSRHSIANEWALINLDSISGHNVLSEEKKLENIKTNLFVKWLLAKSKISITPESEDGKSPSPKAKFIIPNSKGKRVLLIEDEWNKGWLELWRAFLPEAEVDYIPIEKNTILEDLKKLMAEKIKGSDYDLFLLDVRLLDSDHNEDDFKKYSGFEVLKLIKKKNKGYQVIITSASNKQWIYDYGRECGADGVFIKPDLEMEVDKEFLEQNIQKPIEWAFGRKYLKEIYQLQKDIKENFKSKNYNEEYLKDIDEFENDLKTSLSIAFNTISSGKQNSVLYGFLTYFKLLESYCLQKFVRTRSKDTFWVKTFENTDELVWEPDTGKLGGNVKIKLEFFKDKYPFQDKDSNQTICSATKLNNFESVNLKTREIKLSALLERIAVLYFRCDFNLNEMAEFLELNYLRNNLVGHNTKNIDPNKRKLRDNDVVSLIKIIKKVLIGKNEI